MGLVTTTLYMHPTWKNSEMLYFSPGPWTFVALDEPSVLGLSQPRCWEYDGHLVQNGKVR